MTNHPANHDGAVRLSSVLLGIAGSAAIHMAALAVLFVTLGAPDGEQTSAEAVVARGQPILVRLVESEIDDEIPLPEPEPVDQPVTPEETELPEPARPTPTEGEAGAIRLATNWCEQTMDALAETTTQAVSRTLERAIAIERIVSRIAAHVPDSQKPTVAPSDVAMGPPMPTTSPTPTQATSQTPPVPDAVKPPPSSTPVRSTPQPVGISSGAAVVSVPEPLYPSRSIRLGQEGMVEIEVDVLPDGAVGDARIVASSGHRLLDRAALEAARRGTYTSAKENGRAVAATILVPFEFHLH